MRMQVCLEIMRFSQDFGYAVKGLDVSPIKGPKGNEEYLLWLGMKETKQEDETLVSWSKRVAGVN